MDYCRLIVSFLFLFCCIHATGAAKVSRTAESGYPNHDHSMANRNTPSERALESAPGELLLTLLVMQDKSYPCSMSCVRSISIGHDISVHAFNQPERTVETIEAMYGSHFNESECEQLDLVRQCLDKCPSGQTRRLFSILIDSHLTISLCSKNAQPVINDKSCNFSAPLHTFLDCENNCTQRVQYVFFNTSTLDSQTKFEYIGSWISHGCQTKECWVSCAVNYLKYDAACNHQAVNLFHDNINRTARAVAKYMEEIGMPKEKAAACHWGNLASLNQASIGFMVLMLVILTFFKQVDA